MSLSRRQFLKRLGLVAGVGLIGSLFTGEELSPSKPMAPLLPTDPLNTIPVGVIASGEHIGKVTSISYTGESLWITNASRSDWPYGEIGWTRINCGNPFTPLPKQGG